VINPFRDWHQEQHIPKDLSYLPLMLTTGPERQEAKKKKLIDFNKIVVIGKLIDVKSLEPHALSI